MVDYITWNYWMLSYIFWFLSWLQANGMLGLGGWIVVNYLFSCSFVWTRTILFWLTLCYLCLLVGRILILSSIFILIQCSVMLFYVMMIIISSFFPFVFGFAEKKRMMGVVFNCKLIVFYFQLFHSLTFIVLIMYLYFNLWCWFEWKMFDLCWPWCSYEMWLSKILGSNQEVNLNW